MEIFCEKMDRFIDQYTGANGNTGHLRVTVKDQIVYEKNIGYANMEKKLPFHRGSLFTLYSVSKPFCAIGLLKLTERGLVDLSSHPGHYVPEASGFHPEVTVRHLLQHISGVPDFMQTGQFHKKYPSGLPHELREQLTELGKYPAVFAPGEGQMYANINYILCALIIENVTGQDYGEYMQAEVFTPLGMKTAQVDGPGLVLADRVQGYELADGRPVPIDRFPHWMFGAGDILATADDVYCLNRAIKHRLLLKAETWEQVLTPSPLNAMGMGCRVNLWHGKRRITHNGGSDGFRTLHIQLPEDDFDIIYLSNSGWGNARGDYAEAIFKAWYGTEDGTRDTAEMDKGYI